ncbi:hypothetical protein AVEN_212577-1 [Araneus ventricosus]|uniref:Reverse transcriptase domain-containing protein n=1 Tax=Araneus ventricosus TaxID=182803 RepID=A0A4Y2LQ42_ARAVE|nr:hypothetical protein AVEN_212577-1 [Araneus ventricosus]
MEFQRMLDLGHMHPSSSNYASPLHMVPKKRSNDWRPVGDFRALIAQTRKDKYPIPSVLDFTSELHGTKIFSNIDLVKAFHPIRLLPRMFIKLLFVHPSDSSRALGCNLVCAMQQAPFKNLLMKSLEDYMVYTPLLTIY